MPVSLDRVAAYALALAGVEERDRRGCRVWAVGDKVFAWERHFSKADIRRFGDNPVPEGPIVAVRVVDLGEKDAVLAQYPAGVFTIPHFDNYAAVLIDLKLAPAAVVKELIQDGCRAMRAR